MIGDIRRSAIGRMLHATLLIGGLSAMLAGPAALADSGGNHQPPAVPAQARAQGEALTQEIVDLSQRHGRATGAEKGRILADLRHAAEARYDLLADLIESNPGEVLRLALPDRIRGGMPAEVQAWLEQRAEIEGKLEVLHIDMPNEADSRFAYFLTTDLGERFSLHFAGQAPDWVSGTEVRAGGVLLDGVETQDAAGADGAMAVEAGDGGIENLAFAGGAGGSGTPSSGLTNTLGEQRTLVIAVNFQDKPSEQPWTLAQISDVVFGTTDAFFRENSWNQTWLAGDVYGWHTIAVNSTECNTTTIANAANAAAQAAGAVLGDYARLVYVHPTNACGFAGAATIGGNPSRAWLNGSLDPRVVEHEYGHTFGMWHAHGLECGAVTLGTNCQNGEYADLLDVMGQRIAHVNAFHKDRLGWLGFAASPPITTVETDGAYSITPYENGDATPKALKILKSTDPVTGQRSWFYVEQRQPIGLDAWITAHPNVLNGVIVRQATESDGNSSNLLDMTPNSDFLDWYDPALEVGRSFADATSGVIITALSANAAGATVSVTVSPAPPCVRADPVVAISPAESLWVPAGTMVTYTASVTNNDNSACASSSFTLTSSVPSGWSAAYASPSLTLGSGASGSTTLQVTSAPSAGNGFYNVTATATNGSATGFAGTATAAYVVSNPVVNQPPVAVNDSKTFTTIAPVTIPVLVNDSDPDSDPLAVTVATQGAKGTVTINGDGTLTYTPKPRFKGSDAFAYTISDGRGGSASANVTVQKVRK